VYTPDPESLAATLKEWRARINNPRAIVTDRTIKQNSSLHKGLRNLADQFNLAGKDMRKVLKPAVDIPWTSESIKEYMFNPIAGAMFDGRTSSELSTTEIQEVWDVLNRHTGEKHGITVPWPDRFNSGGEE
jgi:hypothetical protein